MSLSEEQKPPEQSLSFVSDKPSASIDARSSPSLPACHGPKWNLMTTCLRGSCLPGSQRESLGKRGAEGWDTPSSSLTPSAAAITSEQGSGGGGGDTFSCIPFYTGCTFTRSVCVFTMKKEKLFLYWDFIIQWDVTVY